MSDEVIIRGGLPTGAEDVAAALYWEAFGTKLARVLGPRERALAFILRVMRSDQCLAALSPSGALLALAGIKTAEGVFVDGGLRDLAAVYGLLGALWRAAALALLERPLAPGVLLMDGIAEAGGARGMGIGTMLLDAVEAEARRRGLGSVRLDVIDTNPKARALYERRGYLVSGQERLGPFRALFGFAAATTMIKRLPRGDADAA
ncbi:MAG: GNAT family N-acetyltransferase [Pseudomonadota bacterium]